MNDTQLHAVADSISGLVSESTPESTGEASNAVSQTGKLALLAKAGKTDLLLLTLLAAEFGPQIQTGLAHVPGCG